MPASSPLAGLPVLTPIGHVESTLVDRAAAPKQGREGAPLAWLVLVPHVAMAARDLRVGDELIVLTWLDRADPSVLEVHPRDNQTLPLTGVFSTRSPDRPNPIGLHRVTVVARPEPLRLQVRDLEAIHLTPILDLKPVLPSVLDA